MEAGILNEAVGTTMEQVEALICVMGFWPQTPGDVFRLITLFPPIISVLDKTRLF